MKLKRDFFECAVDHVADFGDTDIFPYPIELKWIASKRVEISNSLASMDLANYHPMSLVESLIPKTKFGFRVAHQPFPIDTIIYTALVLSIFDKIESGRDSIANNRAFSYRKVFGLDKRIFEEKRKFKDWLEIIENMVFDTQYSHAIRTDISDFYSRIYRHRLENILDSLSGETAIVKKIEKFISDWRGGQSFGLPVGSNASRLLAEAALNDTDMGLISEGYTHTRYVDDMIILIKHGQDPYAALGYLAKQLAENEGLSLNNQKTQIYRWDEFISQIDQRDGSDDDNKEEFATEKLFWSAYGHDETDKAALDALMLKDLQQELESLLAVEFWDMGKIRIVLHAMRLVKNKNVAAYIRKNLSLLVPFAKDICFLIEEFQGSGVGGFEGIGQEITELLLSPRMQPLDCSRAWFLELGVRNIVKFSSAQIKLLDALSGTLDVRQLHLIKWRANDQNYFRSKKAKIQEIQPWAQPTFIFGARCLPKDEYAHWIRSIKSRLQFPLGADYATWCERTYGDVVL